MVSSIVSSAFFITAVKLPLIMFLPSLYACCAGKLATTGYKTDGSSEPVNSSSSRLTARTRKGSL